MKSKLLPIFLFLLIILNGVLIFMLVKKPHENLRNNPSNNFLTEQLQFSEDQKEAFQVLDEEHRNLMIHFEETIKDQKDILFSSFNNEDFNVDSLTVKIGLLEAKKDAQVFSFFKKVRRLCTVEQAKKFDKIIKQAIRGGERRPPNDGRMPPPRNEGMPPPPR